MSRGLSASGKELGSRSLMDGVEITEREPELRVVFDSREQIKAAMNQAWFHPTAPARPKWTG